MDGQSIFAVCQNDANTTWPKKQQLVFTDVQVLYEYIVNAYTVVLYLVYQQTVSNSAKLAAAVNVNAGRLLRVLVKKWDNIYKYLCTSRLGPNFQMKPNMSLTNTQRRKRRRQEPE